ncbi:2S albumin-like cysteine protease inhibitor [Cryptomeria japonica]|uniref:2S albumin-like cysteine protease inhibitor n=1 Tax=Cryptomeria japonica TaxID=3369 RepID=UPI0027DA0223|nr:2S albumin-like cysteine protease inhibitor [Cryptomeria japonica]
MKQQSTKWVAMGVLVLISFTMAVAECEEKNQGRQQQCDPQRLSDCRNFMRGQSDYGQGQQGQPPRRCCEELRQMPQQCRCDAIQRVFDQEQGEGEGEYFDQQGGGQGRERQQEILERARELPSRCNTSPRRCNIQRRGIFMRGNIW